MQLACRTAAARLSPLQRCSPHLQRALHAVPSPTAPPAAALAVRMGAALSLLPGRGRRGAAAAAGKGGSRAMDRPEEEDPDLW